MADRYDAGICFESHLARAWCRTGEKFHSPRCVSTNRGERRPGVFVVYEHRPAGRHIEGTGTGDSGVIEEFCKGARDFTRFLDVMGKPRRPDGLLESIRLGVRMLPFMGNLQKYGRMSTQEFAARFRDPFLRQASMPRSTTCRKCRR